MYFAVIGDSGTGDIAQHAVAAEMCSWRNVHPFDLVVTTGDNVYPDGSPTRFDDAFYEPYSCLLQDGVRFRATLGNHDFATDEGRPEIRDDAFGIRRRNYVVRRDGVRFVLVDSNRLNREWLRSALKPEPGDRWTIVAFHHPVISPGALHGSTPGFEDLPALFERKGVDLVLNGHDHIYAASRPRAKIRYVVTGGGGAPLYPCGVHGAFEICVSRFHFLYVRAGAENIWVRAVTGEGRILDAFRTSGR